MAVSGFNPRRIQVKRVPERISGNLVRSIRAATMPDRLHLRPQPAKHQQQQGHSTPT